MPSTKNPSVDAFLGRQSQWRAEFEKLRAVFLASGLDEELKWGQPCYSLEGKNVALMHGFKEYCAVLFHQGALLKDPKGVLVQQTKNVQAARQLRFTSVEDVAKHLKTFAAYLREAIENERAGRKVELKKTDQFAVPDELSAAFSRDRELEASFKRLTPGRQRAYLLYFGQAKQAKTREERVEKHAPRILEGLGLDD